MQFSKQIPSPQHSRHLLLNYLILIDIYELLLLNHLNSQKQQENLNPERK